MRNEDNIPLLADDDVIMQCLRKNWGNWTVTDKSLEALNKKDEIYFCGASLRILYKVNAVIGDSMIFSPAELASQLV